MQVGGDWKEMCRRCGDMYAPAVERHVCGQFEDKLMAVNKSSIDGKFKSKEYAAENKDTTAAISKMNGLTKIFDLVREEKLDEAKRRVSKLSPSRFAELHKIANLICYSIAAEAPTEPAPSDSPLPAGWVRGNR